MADKDQDFERYIDDLLVAIADRQTDHDVSAVDICALHADRFSDCPPTWAELASREMARLGWGADESTLSDRRFRINGAGLRHVHEVRNHRRPRSIAEKIMAVPRSDWIALGALVVSLLALFAD